MDYQEQKGEGFIPSSSNIVKSSQYNSRISGFMDQAHSVNTLHLMSAFCQVMLGFTVVILSTAGLVNPAWLSITLSMFASVTTMLGLYFLYTVISQSKDACRLLRDAMRRIMDAKN